MKVCHIMWGEKFTVKYINLINNNFDLKEHIFIIINSAYIKEFNYNIPNYSNIVDFKFSLKSICKLFDDFKNYDLILIHSLFSFKFTLFLLLNIKRLHKVNWVIWGADLYSYKGNGLKHKIKESIRKKIISRLGTITAVVKGDYNLAKNIYKSKAKYNYAFYPAITDFGMLDSVSKKNHNRVIIQVGNSPDPTNNHLQIFYILKKYKKENIEIVCPLSYGSKNEKNYVKNVINIGKRYFGKKFKPLLNYMSPEEYSKILTSVDIAIFNHKRQQALGNINALLYLGKKVYIRSDITPWSYFKNLGVKLYDSTKLVDERFNSLIEFDKEVGLANKEIIRKEFSDEHCVELWKKNFE